MAKGPFGLRRLSDALAMITPKKLKKKYFQREDEEDDMMMSDVSFGKVRPASVVREVESSYESDGSCLTVRDNDQREGIREEGCQEPAKV